MTDSTIDVSDNFQIANLTVALNISHQRPSDLTVFLMGSAPNDQPIQLFNFTGDNNLNDFNGSCTAGDWTLEIFDNKKKKTGTLNDWSITVDY